MLPQNREDVGACDVTHKGRRRWRRTERSDGVDGQRRITTQQLQGSTVAVVVVGGASTCGLIDPFAWTKRLKIQRW